MITPTQHWGHEWTTQKPTVIQKYIINYFYFNSDFYFLQTQADLQAVNSLFSLKIQQ